MSKIAWIDLETTGLFAKKNGVVQIACKIERDGRIIDKFVSYVKPLPDDEIAQQALDVNGLTREQLLTFPEPKLVLIKFKQFLERHMNKYDRTDKFVIGGYNTKFDMDFLREWFKKCNEKYFGSYFYWLEIDVMRHAVMYYTLTNQALPTGKGQMTLPVVAERHGIKVIDAHDAEADITMTRELFHRLNSKIVKEYVYATDRYLPGMQSERISDEGNEQSTDGNSTDL